MFQNSTSLESVNIPVGLSGLKVLQFSDLHYLVTVDNAYLEKLVNKINLTKPDIVVFTGDLLDSSISYLDDDYNDLTNALKKIECSLSKYYVKGEEDYKIDAVNHILEDAGFIDLTNKSDIITSSNLDRIEIYGFGSFSRGDLVARDSNLNTYSIALFHEADMINQLKNFGFDLALAGHSHGNQINLGFINQMFSKENAKEHVKGFYEVNHTKLFVNNGIGSSSNIKLRFFNPPSISLFRLVHAS